MLAAQQLHPHGQFRSKRSSYSKTRELDKQATLLFVCLAEMQKTS